LPKTPRKADLSRARKQAQQAIVVADADLERSRRAAEQTIVTAKAESESRILAGKGESQRVMQTGLAEATVLMRKVASYGDPRLYALTLAASSLAQSAQPLVPERVFMTGGGNSSDGVGVPNTLTTLLKPSRCRAHRLQGGRRRHRSASELNTFADRMTRKAMEAIEADCSTARGKREWEGHPRQRFKVKGPCSLSPVYSGERLGEGLL